MDRPNVKRRLFVQSLAWFAGAITGFFLFPWLKKASPAEAVVRAPLSPNQLTPEEQQRIRANGIPLLIEQGRSGAILWHDHDNTALHFVHLNSSISMLRMIRGKDVTIEYTERSVRGRFNREWIDDFQRDHKKLYAFMEAEVEAHTIERFKPTKT